ncbi:hypothetical protein [Bauldia litoralis]|uniref:hypothetical protein n=1 Tax=Bauldia litoralis TaxID=665467 RepID=UPI001113C767|nr:hypothetical protein [Bauldia litoralis]
MMFAPVFIALTHTPTIAQETASTHEQAHEEGYSPGSTGHAHDASDHEHQIHAILHTQSAAAADPCSVRFHPVAIARVDRGPGGVKRPPRIASA